MNPPCARCNKTVYPVEKLTCLDKTWHKGCFSCEVCKLKLTMKTYKGYNKLPYCNTHYPTTKFTQVADTPEGKRLAQQTKQQSEITYRKDKMEHLAQFTQVSDVSTRHAQQSARLASNIGYQTAPSDVERVGGNQPPPASYHQPPPPQPSFQQPPPQQPPPQQPPPQTYQPPVPEPEPPRPPPPAASKVPRYVAIYDYSAADDDEVSFVEGDTLVDVTVIDEGWMEGRVERTGQYGMLPSNYIEKQ